MAIQTVCLACGGKTEVGDDHLGRVLPCPNCGASMNAEPTAPPVIGGPEASQRRLGVLIAIVLAGPILIAGVPILVIASKNPKPTHPDALVLQSISVVYAEVTEKSRANNEITVEVRNDGPETISHVELLGRVLVRDREVPWAEGLANCKIPGGLAPGESQIWLIEIVPELWRSELPRSYSVEFTIRDANWPDRPTRRYGGSRMWETTVTIMRSGSPGSYEGLKAWKDRLRVEQRQLKMEIQRTIGSQR